MYLRLANLDTPIVILEELKINPDFNNLRDNIPKIDILVIPSAEYHMDSDLNDENLINFIKQTYKDPLLMT